MVRFPDSTSILLGTGNHIKEYNEAMDAMDTAHLIICQH